MLLCRDKMGTTKQFMTPLESCNNNLTNQHCFGGDGCFELSPWMEMWIFEKVLFQGLLAGIEATFRPTSVVKLSIY